MAPMKIAIVGAGIGGPAAAIGLARNGHLVTIYERSTATSEVGYAFRITPNSDRCLKYLGIDTIAGGAVAANSVRMYDADGNVEEEVKENQDPEKAKRGTSVFASRPQLNQQLLDAAKESGVTIRLGVKVKSIDVQAANIALDDGTKVSADLIIAADGVHVDFPQTCSSVASLIVLTKWKSVVRPYIVDTSKHFPSASTGHNAFRFMVSTAAAQDDPVLSTVISKDYRMFTWRGNNKRILVYPVDYGKQFNVTCTHPESLSDSEASDTEVAVLYNQKVSFATVQSIYSEFPAPALRLLEMADPNGFRVWKLQDMNDIPTWSLNNTVLLGDACHPVSPFGFSGASMAIEDALTLSTLLTADIEPAEIQRRLKLYEEIRRSRVARVRETARVIGAEKEDKEFVMAYRNFLTLHDAVEYAKEALSKTKDAESAT